LLFQAVLNNETYAKFAKVKLEINH
jgi:hypothetical protein